MFLTDDAYRFVRCKVCSFVFQNPRPNPEELEKRYGSEYFNYEAENEDNFFKLMRLGLRDIGFDRIEKALSEQGERRFLDVGCATGKLIATLASEGWAVQGVEVCRESALFGIRERGLDIFIGTLEAARLPEEYFSVVHCSHLIEHLTDPVAFIREVRRILVPGGFAVITTPNNDGFQARLFGGQWRSYIADHMCLFSKRTLSRLLDAEGFVTLRIRTWGGLAKGAGPVWLKSILDRLVKPLGAGDVMICLAQKR